MKEGGNSYLPAYDGMGNIHAMLTAALVTFGGTTYNAGDIVAAYEYDAFGNTLRESGPYAASNPFRFATKYADVETGLVYHDTRYYSPSLGRFLNRDTIGEQGGLNLYAYVTNRVPNAWDLLGMDRNMAPDESGNWIEQDGRTFEDNWNAFVSMSNRVATTASVPTDANGHLLTYSSFGSGVNGWARSAPSAGSQYVVTYHTQSGVTTGTVAGQTVSFSDRNGNTATIDQTTAQWVFSSNVAPTVPASVLGNGALGLYTVQQGFSENTIMVTPTNTVTTNTGFVNGITGKLIDHANLGFQHLDSSANYTLFNIPTQGFLGDVYDVGLQKLGIDTPASTALAGVLQSVTNSGASVQWVAHSGGGAAFAQAMNYAMANGSSGLGGNSVRFDGGANNAIMTDRIARAAGVSTGYYYSHADFVPNVIGTNGNPVSIAISTLIIPTLFYGPPLSPHTKPTPNYSYRQGNVAPSGPPVLATPTF